MGSSPVTVSVLVNDELMLFTALADMRRVTDVVANSIENLTNVGTPTLTGFNHLKATELEVTFITETLCGEPGGPVDLINLSKSH